MASGQPPATETHPPNASIKPVRQGIHANKPSPAATPILGAFIQYSGTNRQRGPGPLRYPAVRTDPTPAHRPYHRTFRNMFNATSVRKIAKARFKGLGFIEWASFTP